MTKEEAAALRGAIQRIESGRVALGVQWLRWLLSAQGLRTPPPRLIEAADLKRKQQASEER